MLPFVHPFTAIVAAPTSYGKIRFRLIDNIPTVIYPPSTKIVSRYGEYQELFRRYPQIQLREGLPNIENFDGREPTLVIIDDLMQETNETVSNMFTKGSHHRNMSVVFLVQNLFPKTSLHEP